MITFDELIKEHEQLWVDTTLDQQCQKWIEEYQEFRAETEYDKIVSEQADMVIVSAGIARFDYLQGIYHLVDSVKVFTSPDLWDAVEKKMEKNRSRKWAKQDDVGYHHIGD